MRILRAILHIYSYLFHLILTLFLAGISAVGWLSGTTNFDIEYIPWWSGQSLVNYVLMGSLLGLLFLGLAVFGRLRPLFAVWTLAVCCVILYAHFLSPSFRYQGMDDFKTAMWLNGASIVAMLGGLSQARREKKRHA